MEVDIAGEGEGHLRRVVMGLHKRRDILGREGGEAPGRPGRRVRGYSLFGRTPARQALLGLMDKQAHDLGVILPAFAR
jgi:hypothetical protein